MTKIITVGNKIVTSGNKIVTNIWSPYNIPGMKLWLRADAGVVKDGDNLVAEWQDQSGNDYHAEQGVQANKPLLVDVGVNGKPVLRFDGNQVMLADFQQNFAQPNTFFVVWRDYDESRGCAFSTVSTNAVRLLSETDDRIVGNAGSALQFSGSNVKNSFVVSTWVSNTTNSQLFENGIFKVSGNNGNNTVTRLLIGKLDGSSAYDLDGDIAEIIFYNSLLSDQQRQSVEQYLMAKYAL